ncbi:type II toxin-antitoxin system RelE/ParE family toxin [Oceanisphaera sediminis]|uniref:Type II toxin-antitoxin system RelE/ParE family toxin n=1 Tax=Oceanisphaera sediminis TaxID=981381 RepID=A0ABP7DHD6_9GAMM
MWNVETTDLFDEWLDAQDNATQEKVLAGMLALQKGGPSIGRPLVDSVYGSAHSNMKELRIQHQGDPLRAFFAFDPNRTAMVLCAGNKVGDEKRFYKRMIPIADEAYAKHLATLTR